MQRDRPSGAGLDATIRDDSIGWGYVSGHTTVAFALYSLLRASTTTGDRLTPVSGGARCSGSRCGGAIRPVYLVQR